MIKEKKSVSTGNILMKSKVIFLHLASSSTMFSGSVTENTGLPRGIQCVAKLFQNMNSSSVNKCKYYVLDTCSVMR